MALSNISTATEPASFVVFGPDQLEAPTGSGRNRKRPRGTQTTRRRPPPTQPPAQTRPRGEVHQPDISSAELVGAVGRAAIDTISLPFKAAHAAYKHMGKIALAGAVSFSLYSTVVDQQPRENLTEMGTEGILGHGPAIFEDIVENAPGTHSLVLEMTDPLLADIPSAELATP